MPALRQRRAVLTLGVLFATLALAACDDTEDGSDSGYLPASSIGEVKGSEERGPSEVTDACVDLRQAEYALVAPKAPDAAGRTYELADSVTFVSAWYRFDSEAQVDGLIDAVAKGVAACQDSFTRPSTPGEWTLGTDELEPIAGLPDGAVGYRGHEARSGDRDDFFTRIWVRVGDLAVVVGVRGTSDTMPGPDPATLLDDAIERARTVDDEGRGD